MNIEKIFLQRYLFLSVFFLTLLDESSEEDYKSKKNNSSCETLNKFGTLELSTSSNHSRKSGKFQKLARQSQLKR